MNNDVERVRAEFDRIASAGAVYPDAHGLYDDVLLRLVPESCARALEIGCGTGRLTRALARRVARVTAVDLSPEMLRVARSRSSGIANIEYRLGDVLELTRELGTFDCVVSISTFHHLPAGQGAAAMKAAVSPGGRIIIQDLWRTENAADHALDAVRLPVKLARLWCAGGRLRQSATERAAWRDHERGEMHPTMRDVEALRDRHFAGAALHKHFLWRYTLIWKRP